MGVAFLHFILLDWKMMRLDRLEQLGSSACILCDVPGWCHGSSVTLPGERATTTSNAWRNEADKETKAMMA